MRIFVSLEYIIKVVEFSEKKNGISLFSMFAPFLKEMQPTVLTTQMFSTVLHRSRL